MTKNKIKNLIEQAIQKAFPEVKNFEIEIEYPQEEIHGDYATNVAMSLANQIKQNPLEIAQALVAEIKKGQLFEKIEIKKPGFVNFFLSPDYLHNQINKILNKKDNFGSLQKKEEKVQVEFISANPTGPLTIGNARGGFLGDTLANILIKAGYQTEKAYYVNDCGNQILALGHSVLKNEKAAYKGDYIEELSQRIKEKDPFRAGERAAQIILEEMIKKTTNKMRIKYDEWTSEKDFYESGLVDKIIKLLEEKKLTFKKDGAVWFKSSQFGDKRDRVLIKSNGDKTYLAGDIAHHYYKFKEKSFDRVINVWGSDHHGDVPGLGAGVEAIGFKGKLETLILQFVTLFQGKEKMKMSKRAGTYVTVDELLEEVGVDVARFFFLQRSADKHLNFDLNLAKEKSDKNPVYYVQYAHARMCSILEKAGKNINNLDFSKLQHSSELGLIKELICYPEIIEKTSQDYQIQRIPQYAVDLAKAFSQFYRDCHVLIEDKELQKARIALVIGSRIVLRDCLKIMEVSAPEQM